MKKILISLLTVFMIICLTGCGETESPIVENAENNEEVNNSEIQVKEMKYMSSVSCVGDNCDYVVYFGANRNLIDYFYYKINFIKGCDNYGSWFLNNVDLDVLPYMEFPEENIEYSYTENEDNCTLIFAATFEMSTQTIQEIIKGYRPSCNEAYILYYLCNEEEEIYQPERFHVNEAAKNYADKHGYCSSINITYDENSNEN